MLTGNLENLLESRLQISNLIFGDVTLNKAVRCRPCSSFFVSNDPHESNGLALVIGGGGVGD
jgi:hypothetical protein